MKTSFQSRLTRLQDLRSEESIKGARTLRTSGSDSATFVEFNLEDVSIGHGWKEEDVSGGTVLLRMNGRGGREIERRERIGLRKRDMKSLKCICTQSDVDLLFGQCNGKN